MTTHVVINRKGKKVRGGIARPGTTRRNSTFAQKCAIIDRIYLLGVTQASEEASIHPSVLHKWMSN
jgi:hypothetical protein